MKVRFALGFLIAVCVLSFWRPLIVIGLPFALAYFIVVIIKEDTSWHT